MNIRNTTADMRDPANAMLLIAEAMATGSPSAAIERMEADGQRQLVNSDQLPTAINGRASRADFEALGFTFGDPDPSDRLFAPATLPAGWKREGSDHNMWSYLVDEHGRRRVSIFYKAAFYDRDAFMSLNTVFGYVQGQLWDDKPIITDGEWATVDAVRAALAEYVSDRKEQVKQFETRTDTYCVKRVPELRAEIAKAQVRLERLDES